MIPGSPIAYLDCRYLAIPIPGYGALQRRNLLVSVCQVSQRLPNQHATFSVWRAEVVIAAFLTVSVDAAVCPSVCLSVPSCVYLTWYLTWCSCTTVESLDITTCPVLTRQISSQWIWRTNRPWKKSIWVFLNFSSWFLKQLTVLT